MEAGGEFGDFLFSSSGGSGGSGDGGEEEEEEFPFGDESGCSRDASSVVHADSHFLGEHTDSLMSDAFGNHDEGSVEQVSWPRGERVLSVDGAALFAVDETARQGLAQLPGSDPQRHAPLAANPPVRVPVGAAGVEEPGWGSTKSVPRGRGGPRAEPSSAGERQRRSKRTRAWSSPAQPTQQVAIPAGDGGAAARELAVKCAAAWEQAPIHSSLDQYESLSPESVFEIINDKRNFCQGSRPKIVSAADAGKLFLERVEGVPGRIGKSRRGNGLQKWKQGDMLWMKRVEPYRYGPGNKGEVWARARYGQVDNRGIPDGSVATATPQKFRYNMYELHWFNNGRPEPEITPVAAARRGTRNDKVYGADKSDWMQGVLYQLRKAKHDVAAASLDKSANPVRGTLTMQLDAEQGDRKWIQFNDGDGLDKGAIQLSAQGRLELESNAGDFAEYHLIDPLEAARGGPFEEGDIVGFGANGLTRRTKGVKQLGVITRRAIIKGSRPSADLDSDLSQFDTVAYTGIVPVKVRAMGWSWRSCGCEPQTGSFVAPSGLEDGTGVIVHDFPKQRVGRTLATSWVTLPADADQAVTSSCTAKVLICVKSTRRLCWRFPAPSVLMNDPMEAQWQLVSISVVDPTQSFAKGNTRLCITARVGIGLCCVVLFVYLLLYHLPCTYFGCTCEPVVLTHGQTSGACDGTVGSSCRYERCDAGFVMVPAARGIEGYDFGPSDEANRMIADYGDCKKLHSYEENDMTEMNIAEALELQGWTCYRHGVGTDNHSKLADTRAAQLDYGQANYDWGWCISRDHSSYCAIKPPVCTVCDYPAIDSGWRNCEFSGALEGSERVCMLPNYLLYDETHHEVGSGKSPVLDNCLRHPVHEDHDSVHDRWIGQSSTKTTWNDPARRYRVAEICTLPSLSGNAGVTKNNSIADRRRKLVQQHVYSSNGASLEHERGKLNTSVQLDMECHAASLLLGASFYIGTPMHCVELHCPAETVSLRSIQACQKCEDKDAIVHFPRTSTIGADDVNGTSTVMLDCPVGFRGSVRRTCGVDGRWSATNGACTRLHCAELRVSLWADSQTSLRLQEVCRPEALSQLESDTPKSLAFIQCMQVLQRSVVFDEVVEGTGTMLARCPWPSHVGHMSAVCLPGATTWTSVQGQCEALSCPATSHDVNVGNRTLQIRLPQQIRSAPGNPIGLGDSHEQIGVHSEQHWSVDTLLDSFSNQVLSSHWAVVPCCSEWTNTGSCIDDAGAIGWVLSQCADSEHDREYGNGDPLTRRIYAFSEEDRLKSAASLHGRDVNLGCKPLESLIEAVRLDQGEVGNGHAQRTDSTSDIGREVKRNTITKHSTQTLTQPFAAGTHRAKDPLGVPGDNAQDVGSMLYRAFASNVDRHVQNSTNGQWSLPRSGVLSSVSVAIRQRIGQPANLGHTARSSVGNRNGHTHVENPLQWRPVVASSSNRRESTARTVTIDATMSSTMKPPEELSFDDTYEAAVYAAQRSAGRSAAAFADAACQQMNYSRAVIVTTCKALYNAVVGQHISTIPHEDLEWWNNRGAAYATYNGSNRTVRPSLDDIVNAQGVPLLAELCPEIIEHLPEPGPGQPNDDTTHARSFGKISADVLQRQCSTWVEVEKGSDHQPSYQDAWSNMLRWNREHPRNYSTQGPPWWLTTEEDGAEASRASAERSTVLQEYLSPFPSYSSCSGHPKEAEDISRCFVAQLQRRLDFPRAIDAKAEGSKESVSDDRPCINKLIVGCSNERHAAARLVQDNHQVKGPQKHIPRHTGVWVIGDQTHATGVEGNWLAPKIFTDFGGPYDCVTGTSVATRTAQDHGLCYGKLLEYWVG